MSELVSRYRSWDGSEASLLPDATPVDDCWNCIGTQGDRSCPRLKTCIRCRNCEVYAASAIQLLDRYALHAETLDTEEIAPEQHVVEGERVGGRTSVVFRLGEEWLALPSRHLVEVVAVGTIHSLPHQRSASVLGVVNVRGVLVVCVNLTNLVGGEMGITGGGNRGRITPRMLIIAAPQGAVVAPVEEVAGIYPLDLEQQTPLTVADNSHEHCCSGVLRWRGRSVRLIEGANLMAHIERAFI